MSGLHVRKTRKWGKDKTVTLSPYGRVPIKDAAQPVVIRLGAGHIKHGARNVPSACAIALAARDQADKFPGELVGVYTYKTFTLIATQINNKIQARRYVHPKAVNDAINGFDKASEDGLRVGDEVTLLAPKTYRKLGASNGRSNPRSPKPKQKRKAGCWSKRGVFVDPFHAKQAQREGQESQRDTSIIIK